jgi:glycosyltransferase involved in cell wall biosynthesis
MKSTNATKSANDVKTILMTADCVGGVWTYAVELAAALAEYDVRVVLATMGPLPHPEQRAAAWALPNVLLRESDHKLEWMDEPWDDVQAAGKWLLSLEREFTPDVIHLGGYTHAALPFTAPVIVTAHSCVLSWWEAVRGEPAPTSVYRKYHESVAAGIAASDLLVAPSHAMLDAIEQHYGLPERARVIYNGRDPAAFRHRVAKEPGVLAAGRLWDEGKNLGTLRRAALTIDWPVYVAGDATSPEGGTVDTAGVLPLGTLDTAALRAWMSRTAVFALPAKYEPFGLTALEAALSGCALVLGDIPSLREIWGDAATFVRPDDAEGLAAAIRRLADHPPLLREMSDRAFQRAQRFNTQRMAEQYMWAYRQLRTIGRRQHAVATTVAAAADAVFTSSQLQ